MINKLKELRAGGEEEGFTLIELMIVVVIIGILAAIAIPVFANQQKSAIAAGVKSDVKNTNTNIATALTKVPTAIGVAGVSTGGSNTNIAAAATPAITNSAVAYTIVVSDSATNIAVTGGWNSYVITATNASVSAGSLIYRADSGKYVDTLS